ncbi:hypothetical protein FQN55_000105 [Onygenales sp. PD_40]|nr:hypothetical protein FQN55_000105 [Onygenales sp. PD_40]
MADTPPAAAAAPAPAPAPHSPDGPPPDHSPPLDRDSSPRPDSSSSRPAVADPAPVINREEMAQLERVLQSEIGVSILLTRLKQSIASARDFSSFLRKRALLEEDHAQGLKKLARTVHESAQRTDSRQGTFGQSYEEVHRIHDRMADHGLQFALSLQQMSEDMNELATNLERGRKHWKLNGLNAEKKVQDAESMAEKAKVKYNSLAEQYDRAKTGDRQPGKFGLKGPKSAAQQEEDLMRKVQHADADYSSKVQSAQSAKKELITTLRPQAVRALQDLIAEGDSGLSLQMQKFATFTEKLLLGKGLCVSPLNGSAKGDVPQFKSLRDVAYQVDNEKDFKGYVLSHASKVSSSTTEIKYERHPTLAPPAPKPAPIQTTQPPAAVQPPSAAPQIPSQSFSSSPHSASNSVQHQQPPLGFPQQQQQQPPPPPPHEPYGMQHQQQPSVSQPPVQMPSAYLPYEPQPPQPQAPQPPYPVTKNGYNTDLPPLKPVFGVSLEELFRRDGTAIPLIVYQCIQGIELFGLNVEGIYRLSGNANHIAQLKAMFDHDSSKVDFTNPESFFHDVNSVAGLLKQFFRELPDPLFTNKHYTEFINAARKEDDIQRRDALHGLINSLPDPNYATLRSLVLHLNRVQERWSENRMNAGNIAISFGLTLMGSSAQHNIADSGWQARVIETILQNTFQIFDED